MDAVTYQSMYLQSLAQTAQLPGVQPSNTSASSDFQKLLERAKNPQDVEQPEPANKSQSTASTERKDTTVQKKEEDPVETVKRMQVYLTPEDPEVLSQYPAAWLPEVSEGEAIVCIGVQVDENGQQIPILIGENEAYSRFGMKVFTPEVQPQMMNVQEEAQSLIQEPVPTDTASQAELPPQDVVQPQEPAPIQKAAENHSAEDFSAETGEQKKDDAFTVESVEVGPQVLFQDVKAAPIKVGETYAAEQSGEAQDVSQQLADPLVQALAQGESRVVVQLMPESLGSVRVEITQSADGVLHVALSAESSQTRGLLERHAGNLQALLGMRGQDQVQVQVQRQEESQQGQNDHPYEGHNGNQQQGRQQEQRSQHQQQNAQDFLQQLRLGLIPMDAGLS